MPAANLPLLIIGCSGHGRVIADTARAAGHAVAGFLDDQYHTVTSVLNVKGPVRELVPGLLRTHRFIVGIGIMAPGASVSASDGIRVKVTKMRG